METQGSETHAASKGPREGSGWWGEVRTVLPRRRRPRWRDLAPERRLVAVVILGAMAMSGGLSLHLAFKHPPYQADESSQVGYVLTLMDGSVPSLDTDVPAEKGGRELEVAVGRRWPFSVPYIHTAINPPYPYAASIPPALLTSAMGLRAGPLLGVRLFNVVCTTLAIYAVYRLGRELSGSRRVASVAVALFASIIAIAQHGALAYLEGPALLATTGVAWGLARFVRRRHLRDATILGLWCAAAAAVRTMSMAYAVAAGALAAVVGLVSQPAKRWIGLLGRLAGPSIVLVGWFWALNQLRYGNPTGTSEVYGQRASDPRSTLDIFFSWESFAIPLDYLLLEVTGVRGWWDISASRQQWVGVGALALLVAATALVAVRAGSAAHHPPAAAGDRRVVEAGRSLGAWIALLAVSVVAPATIAVHVSNGGAAHPRYLVPVLPVLAVAASLVLCRLGRWLPAAAVAAAVVLLVVRIPEASRVYQDVPWKVLAGPVVDRPGRLTALGVSGLGALSVGLAHVAMAWRTRPSDTT